MTLLVLIIIVMDHFYQIAVCSRSTSINWINWVCLEDLHILCHAKNQVFSLYHYIQRIPDPQILKFTR